MTCQRCVNLQKLSGSKNVYIEGDIPVSLKCCSPSVLTWQVVTAVVFVVITSCYNQSAVFPTES